MNKDREILNAIYDCIKYNIKNYENIGMYNLNTNENYTIDEAINVIKKALEEKEKLEKVIEILKKSKITALKLTWGGTWWTIDVPKNANFYPVAYGDNKEEYDLLKEVFENENNL